MPDSLPKSDDTQVMPDEDRAFCGTAGRLISIQRVEIVYYDPNMTPEQFQYAFNLTLYGGHGHA